MSECTRRLHNTTSNLEWTSGSNRWLAFIGNSALARGTPRLAYLNRGSDRNGFMMCRRIVRQRRSSARRRRGLFAVWSLGFLPGVSAGRGRNDSDQPSRGVNAAVRAIGGALTRSRGEGRISLAFDEPRTALPESSAPPAEERPSGCKGHDLMWRTAFFFAVVVGSCARGEIENLSENVRPGIRIGATDLTLFASRLARVPCALSLVGLAIMVPSNPRNDEDSGLAISVVGTTAFLPQRNQNYYRTRKEEKRRTWLAVHRGRERNSARANAGRLSMYIQIHFHFHEMWVSDERRGRGCFRTRIDRVLPGAF